MQTGYEQELHLHALNKNHICMSQKELCKVQSTVREGSVLNGELNQCLKTRVSQQVDVTTAVL